MLPIERSPIVSYASPLVVYWDPLQDHCWNDKVCHENLSQCQSNFSSSTNLKKSIFGANWGQLVGQLSVFGL